jgi:hypothetical protein
MNNPRAQAVIITGMHRSGTSLAASILQKAGVDIGQNLLGPGIGNVKGHFEDVDLWSLHKDILISQGIDSDGWTKRQQVEVPQRFLERANAIKADRIKHNHLWGWKEPRTTLFLDFWQVLLPEAKYVFLYREPWKILDSLFTRGDKAFINNPELAIDVWTAYNSAILSFHKKNPTHTIIVHFNYLQGKAQDLTGLLKKKLGLGLLPLDNEIYDASIVSKDEDVQYRTAFIEKYYPEAFSLYRALNACADLPGTTPTVEADSDLYRRWILKDWRLNRELTRTTQQIQIELQKTRVELQEARANLQQAQDEINQMKKHSH